MKLFAVLSPNPNPRLEAAIKQQFPDDHLVLALNIWLVAGTMSSVEVCRLLGIVDGSNGSGLVVSFGSYYGRAPRKVRDWITSRYVEDAPSANTGDLL